MSAVAVEAPLPLQVRPHARSHGAPRLNHDMVKLLFRDVMSGFASRPGLSTRVGVELLTSTLSLRLKAFSSLSFHFCYSGYLSHPLAFRSVYSRLPVRE